LEYIVDTNILLSGIVRQHFFFCTWVIEELENHKSGYGELAQNARHALKHIIDHEEKWIAGIDHPSPKMDDKIIHTCKTLGMGLLTKDRAMFVKARLLNVQAILFEDEKPEISYESMEYGKTNISASQAYGIKPKNEEQKKAMSFMLDKDKDLVCLVGKAGSGKTLLALAVGLDLVEQNKYTKVMFLRKQSVVGDQENEVGFLKGSLEEKMAPWVASAYDNLEVILKTKENVDSIIESGLVCFENLGFMRGRSIPNVFMIIDECQNLSALEMKTILTRAGEGTKIILLGDPTQIDTKNLSEFDNGLSMASDLMKGWEYSASCVLKTCVRSRLADKASEVF